MNKPRVAILHYSAPPVIGGVESTIAAHARLLASRGYDVTLIAGTGESSDPRVPLVRIARADSRDPAVALVNKELAEGTAGDAFHALHRALREDLQSALARADICIAHNVPTLHKNLALTLALRDCARSMPLNLIAWCHDFAWTDPVYAPDMHDGFPWDALRQAWEGARYVVVSEGRRAELAALLDLPAESIAVVPPGISAGEFLGLGDAVNDWIRRFDLRAAEPLLLLPARVTRRKNIELAIEITAALRESGHAPKLIVMGPLGPHNPANRAYLEALQALARKREVGARVVFLQQYGTVDDAARRDLYWIADALLFTSEREGFGIPVLEAGTARLPVFCADIPPFRESAGEWAHYFALDEPAKSIAERLAATLDRDAAYRLKRRVAEAYDWERLFESRIEPLLR